MDWKPTPPTAPEHWHRVFVAVSYEGERFTGIGYYDEANGRWYREDGYAFEQDEHVTHWAPFPEPPK